ncbi:MAG: hypothetical protein U0359_37725 [Byssovorax sp.]
MRRLFLGIAALSALLAAAGPALGHALQEGTARVTLRDDHVTVDAQLDVVTFVARASGAASIGEIALASEPDLVARVALARDAFTAEASIGADGERLPLTITQFPAPDEIRALAGWAAASPDAHAELRPVRLEAERALPGMRRVALTLPRAAGPVLVSFVQPAAQMTAPGATASFTVLAAPAEPPSAAAWPSPRAWASAAAVVLALAALFVNTVIRRAPMAPSRIKA